MECYFCKAMLLNREMLNKALVTREKEIIEVIFCDKCEVKFK